MLYIHAMSEQWMTGSVAALLLLVLGISVARPSRVPEGVSMPFGRALRVNAWAVIALGVSFLARWALRQPGWSDPLRIAVALAPLVPGVLYAVDVWRWIRGLDELQRRIQVGAIAFAAGIMGLAVIAVDLLQAAGFLNRFHWSWEFAFAVAFLLWMIGCTVSTRRFA